MAAVHRAMKEEPETDRRLWRKRPATATAEDVAKSAKMKKQRQSREEISGDYKERKPRSAESTLRI